jgi:hypothetical protein
MQVVADAFEQPLTAAEERRHEARQTSSANAHWCRRMPPIPRGFSTLWLGPATNPSSDIAIFKRSLDISSTLPKIWSPPGLAPAAKFKALR